MILPVLIPARGGSKGIPKKNIIDIGGFPLLYYSIKISQISDKIEKIFVSTDSEEIKKVAQKYSANILKRPIELASDFSTDYDVLKHFFDSFPFYEQVVYLRPVTPVRDLSVFNAAIDYYSVNRERCSGMRSMHELAESPHKMFMFNSDGFCQGFFEEYNGTENYTNLPRQRFPKAYMPNGYIDIVKKETVDVGLDFGKKILPFVTSRVFELDTFDDISLVRRDLLESELYWMMSNDKNKK
jgi:CMP-N,N'-diacetyllegionaminic acid synthase